MNTRIKKSKKSMDTVIIDILTWLFYLPNKTNFSVSTIIYNALRYNPSVKSMSKKDSNQVLLMVFKNISFARTGIHSILKLIDEFDRRLITRISIEKSNKKYKSDLIDTIIKKYLFVMKDDLEDALKAISPLISNSSISAAAFWNFLNNSAINANISRRRWCESLSNNASIMELVKQSEIPIEFWLLRNNDELPFDEVQYYKDQEFKKQTNVNSQQIRGVIQLQKSMIFNNNNKPKKQYPNSSNASNSNRPRFNSSQSGNNNYNKNKTVLQTVLVQMTNHLRKHEKNARWDKQYCLFWNHPDYTCKNGDKCNRFHKCPICQSTSHSVANCTVKPITINLNKSN